MTKTVFRIILSVSVAVLTVASLLLFSLQYVQTRNETYTALQQEAIYAERGLMLGGEGAIKTTGATARVTWIAPNGKVLYDSVYTLPATNQGERPEVLAALDVGEGRAIRQSESSGERTMYYARRCADGTVLRLSRPIGATRAALIAISPVLSVVLLMGLISFGLALRLSRRIVRPINELDLDQPTDAPYPELAPLVSRLREQNETISEQMRTLDERQREFTALADNMREGFLLIDRSGDVLSVNESALRLLPACGVGTHLPDQLRAETRAAAETALGGERAEVMLELSGRTWLFIASPVETHEAAGAVILILDVTEQQQRERLRREFSANVSHELKTPLTSISGFAELMQQGDMPPETVRDFSGDIYRESQRLISLVENIIKLSQLDENAELYAPERVDLYDLAADTIDSLAAVAARQRVTLALEGAHAEITGAWPILNEMIYNLCDNAIKYNRPGGSVTVAVEPEGQHVRLTVRDTGIGIPIAHQSRVFERFYRVDKSHSRSLGGTGLGLSIVKHGAQFHGAEIALESTPGEGTAITLTFPAD